MSTLILIVLAVIVLAILAILLSPYLQNRDALNNYQALTEQRYAVEDSSMLDGEASSLNPAALNSIEDEIMGRLSRRHGSQSEAPTVEEKMFQAGLFSQERRRDFRRLQVILPLVLALVGLAYGTTLRDATLMLLCGLIGVILGTYIPLKLLDKWIRERDDEMSFYLPLVIEQVAIGVSSSLDIGPCIARVVQMAEERDSHNPVTELLRFAQAYIKSGASLSDALMEVGRQSGNNEVKHSFRAMAQVSRYGGEISRQLQDLSEAVSSSRDTKIDAKIKKLELAATGPVALVFLGFFAILLMGFGMTLLNAIKG